MAEVKPPRNAVHQIQLRMDRVTEAADFAQVAVTTIQEDNVFLSFAYFEPYTSANTPPDGGGIVHDNAIVFKQVAMPRYGFAKWLASSVALMARLRPEDRDALGWAEIARLVDEQRKEAAVASSPPTSGT